MKNSYDVAIVGGGIVGLTTALALVHAAPGLRIAVLESRATFPAFDPQVQDVRVSAISPASQRIFANLGVWDAMCAMRVSPWLAMHVRDAGGQGAIDFLAGDHDLPALGHIVENCVMQAALSTAIAQHRQIDFLSAVQPAQISVQSESVQIQLSPSTEVCASLLVAADGANSSVREMTGFAAVRKKSYGQQAIVATVKTEFPHRQTAWQRFLPTGPLAFLPLAEPQLASIVWSVDEEAVPALMQADSPDFALRLAGSIEQKFGKIELISDRGLLPLVALQVGTAVASRVALVGDAAHVVHPLAGQGLNLGLLDAAMLAEVVAEAVQKNRDFAARHTLRKYARRRKPAVVSMSLAMDFFRHFFANQQPLIRGMRNLGLSCVNRAGVVKKMLAAVAAGSIGDVPVLAQKQAVSSVRH